MANWFINARVRLWKPMVEEMYKEEFGDSEMASCNLSSESTPQAPRDNKGEDLQDNAKAANNVQQGQLHELKLDHSSTSDFDAAHGIMKLQGDQRPNMNSALYSGGPMPTNHNADGCLMPSDPASYDISEFGNFPVGGHVSLSLELRNCETEEFATSDGGFNKQRNPTLDSTAENNLIDYHFTDSGKQQNRFSNTHLLHEFVV